jgi:hypothetical protein
MPRGNLEAGIGEQNPPGKQKRSTGKGNRQRPRGNLEARTGDKEPKTGTEKRENSEKQGRPRGNLEAQLKNGTLLGNGIGEPEKPPAASEERKGAGETDLENG